MKTLPITLVLAWLMLGSCLANPLTGNPVFQKLKGEWTCEGKLVAADGAETPVKEAWKGDYTETGNFIVSGKRTLDQQEHDFAWEYYPNGDLIEGQMKMSEPKIDTRFEVTVSESARSITLKIPLDAAGTLLTIVNTVSEDGQSIIGTVELVDASGKVTTTGKVEHKKKG